MLKRLFQNVLWRFIHYTTGFCVFDSRLYWRILGVCLIHNYIHPVLSIYATGTKQPWTWCYHYHAPTAGIIFLGLKALLFYLSSEKPLQFFSSEFKSFFFNNRNVPSLHTQSTQYIQFLPLCQCNTAAYKPIEEMWAANLRADKPLRHWINYMWQRKC